MNDNGVFIFTGPYSGFGRHSFRYYLRSTTGEWYDLNQWPDTNRFDGLWGNSTNSPDPFIMFTGKEGNDTFDGTFLLSPGPLQNSSGSPIMVQFKVGFSIYFEDQFTRLKIGYGTVKSGWYRTADAYLVSQYT